MLLLPGLDALGAHVLCLAGGQFGIVVGVLPRELSLVPVSLRKASIFARSSAAILGCFAVYGNIDGSTVRIGFNGLRRNKAQCRLYPDGRPGLFGITPGESVASTNVPSIRQTEGVTCTENSSERVLILDSCRLTTVSQHWVRPGTCPTCPATCSGSLADNVPLTDVVAGFRETISQP